MSTQEDLLAKARASARHVVLLAVHNRTVICHRSSSGGVDFTESRTGAPITLSVRDLIADRLAKVTRSGRVRLNDAGRAALDAKDAR